MASTSEKEIGSMRFVLSTGSLYTKSVAEAFRLAKDAGFDSVELLIDPRPETRDVPSLLELSAQYGLPITSVHSPFRKVPDWPGQKTALRNALEIARRVGARLVVEHLPMWHRYSFLRWLLRERNSLEKEYGVKIGIENMGGKVWWGIRVNPFLLNSPQQLGRIPDIVFDTTHAADLGWNILDAARRLPNIVHVHFSDYDGHRHRIPGRGRLPLSQFLKMFKERQYHGDIVLEVEPKILTPDPETVLQEALTYMREAVAL